MNVEGHILPADKMKNFSGLTPDLNNEMLRNENFSRLCGTEIVWVPPVAELLNLSVTNKSISGLLLPLLVTFYEDKFSLVSILRSIKYITIAHKDILHQKFYLTAFCLQLWLCEEDNNHHYVLPCKDCGECVECLTFLDRKRNRILGSNVSGLSGFLKVLQ